ncbi:MAG TPA: Ig-like domain-containing protein, partial [Gemmatimonadales bacterium]
MPLSRVTSLARVLCAIGIVSLLSACADTGGGTTNPTPVVTSIALSADAFGLDGLGATVQLTATVKDQTGAAMTGQTITWSSDAASIASVGTDGTVTAVGKGTANITATVGTISKSAVATITQNPVTLTKVAGDVQTGTVGQALAVALAVTVADAKSNLIAGVTVAFAVTAGGGTPGTASAVTGADGKATSTWTLGNVAGAAQTATATVTGITQPAGFTATANAGAAATIAAVSGNNQQGAPSAALANPIIVKVTDALNNPIIGTQVTFAVTGGGGSVLPTTASTGATGQTQTAWTLGATLGAQTMTAAATGLGGSPVGFTATASNLTISGIVQDTLTEGTSITINGAGFSATAVNDTVKIDGLIAAVTVASATQLTATVPSYDCLPARDGGTTVKVGAITSNAVVKRIHPAAFVTLAVGAQQIVQNTANFCLQFRPSTVGGDAYMVGVGAAVENAASTFFVTVSTGTGAASSPRMFPVSPLPSTTATVAGGLPAVDAELVRMWRGQRAFEARRREWERTELPRLLASGAALRPSSAARA